MGGRGARTGQGGGEGTGEAAGRGAKNRVGEKGLAGAVAERGWGRGRRVAKAGKIKGGRAGGQFAWACGLGGLEGSKNGKFNAWPCRGSTC